MSILRRASDKLSMFSRAIAVVGIGNALRLELNRVIYRLGLARVYPVITLSLPNNRHKLHLRTGTSDYNVFLHVFLVQTYGPSLAPECIPKVIVDCGANVGYSSWYFLNKFPGVTVVAIEPDPSNARICEMNLEPYGSRVKVLKAAVWSHRCSLELVRLGPHREQSTQVCESSGSHATGIPALDIPTLIERCGGRDIDLLKLDIEGSELQLFTNFAGTWLPRVKNVAIELHGPECSVAFFRALQDYDYELIKNQDTTICRNIVRRREANTRNSSTSDGTGIEHHSGARASSLVS